VTNPITLTYLSSFDEIIDVRTPDEFALDHVPGAQNFPVLSNLERAQVGTLYKQTSEFEAKKLGAALIARNIAEHLQQHFTNRPKTWRPLVYCWRGGMRSGAMQHILRQIGWRAEKLPGGYKAYRHTVFADLGTLPTHFDFKVICGLTGSGKSRLLTALSEQGAQVLDLEQLAQHRGSLLGNLPDCPQPTQKMFDSRVWWQLSQFNPAQPVFVEAESKKIGNLRVPESLILSMWQPGRCLRLQTADALRVTLLKQEYAHFLAQPEKLLYQLNFLLDLYGHTQIDTWAANILSGEWDELVLSLLQQHYDRSYEQSMRLHYPDYADSPSVPLRALDEATLRELAVKILDHGDQPEPCTD
jgi:tRNA 2-selenouridine synthase